MTIAIALFSFLLVGVSQIISVEMKTYHQNTLREEVQQKARRAMLEILDQLRLKALKYYDPGTGGGSDSGIYYRFDPNNPSISGDRCLINVNPSQTPIPGSGTILFYDSGQHKLNYIDNNAGQIHLVADDINDLQITPDGDTMVKITVTAGDSSGNYSFQLVSWTRLY